MLVKKKMCVYREQYPRVWLYFEQNSVNQGVVQHTVALGIAIGKINEKKKVHTNISVYFVPKTEIMVNMTTVWDGTDTGTPQFCLFFCPQGPNCTSHIIWHIHTLRNKNVPRHKKEVSLYRHPTSVPVLVVNKVWRSNRVWLYSFLYIIFKQVPSFCSFNHLF
jgi:hypothetical protein